MKLRQYLVFDIGGTNLKYAVMTEGGKALTKDKVPTVNQDLSSFLASLFQITDKFKKDISGIAICSPGKIDTEHKTIYIGGALPFLDGLNVEKVIGQKYHVPAFVENDGNAAALAEKWQGALKNTKIGVALTLGTAVGGGIIVNEQLLHGNNYQAGEVSMMITDPGQGITNWSAYVGSNTSAVKMIEAINKIAGSKDLNDGKAAFEVIKSGNEEAIRIFEDFCYRVALIIYNMQSVINAEKYIIAGGISAQPLVIKEIQKKLYKIYQSNPGLKNVDYSEIVPDVIAAKLGNDDNLYGALYALLLDLERNKRNNK